MKISYKVLFAAVLSIAGTNAFAADVTGLATTNYVKGAIQSLDVSTSEGSGNVVTAVTQEDGKIKVTKGTTLGAMAAKNNVTNADIAANAAIATSKINGLDTALAGKQTTGNMIQAKADVTEVNMEATDKYPSMAAAQQIASAVVTENLIDVNDEISSLNTKYTNLSATVETNKGAADDAIKALDSSVTNANGAISTITITDGKITNVTRKSVATADLADNAVTTAKIVNANVTKAKLASDVQTSLGKADTALQAVPVATSTALGGVKSGGDITVATGGAVTVAHATKADSATTAGSATKASQDASGNVITSTYATKTEMNTGLNTKQPTLTTGENGNIKGGGSVTVTKDASGVITVSGTDTKYTLPTATTTVKGGIMATSEIAVATDGKATIGTGAVTTAKIADSNVTTAKIADANVTTAKIKSPTTTECADGKCALVDLGSGVQWLPIVNVYE